MHKLILTAIAAALAGFAIACGGGGGDDKAQMEKTIRTMVDAFNDGRGDKMYDQLSKNCQSNTDKKEMTEELAAARAILSGVKLELTKFEVVEQKGDEATIRTTMGIKNAPAIFKDMKPEPEDGRMVKEGGKWKSDDCDGLGVG